jgi:hypothetical protein
MLSEPGHVAALGVPFDLAQQFHNLRLEARLAWVGVGNHGINLDGYDESIGSDQPGSFDSLALNLDAAHSSKKCTATSRYSAESMDATETSSSINGQWMPIPLPINLQLPRCSGVARKSLGNHANGTLTCRPSASLATRSSAVKQTSTANGSTLISEMLMPFLLEQSGVLLDNSTQFG